MPQIKQQDVKKFFKDWKRFLDWMGVVLFHGHFNACVENIWKHTIRNQHIYPGATLRIQEKKQKEKESKDLTPRPPATPQQAGASFSNNDENLVMFDMFGQVAGSSMIRMQICCFFAIIDCFGEGVAALPYGGDNVETLPMDLSAAVPTESPHATLSPEIGSDERRAKYQVARHAGGSETVVMGECHNTTPEDIAEHNVLEKKVSKVKDAERKNKEEEFTDSNEETDEARV